MAIFTVAKDKFGDYLNFTCTERDGTTAIDLTGKTVKLYTWNPRTPATMIIDGGVVDLVVAANGTCRHLILVADFPAAGAFFGKLNITSAGYDVDMPVFFIVVTDGTEYITLEEVKTELNITNDEKDFIIFSDIQRASDFIDRLCDRVFTSTAAVTKYFDGDSPPVFLDDLVSIAVDGLKLDEDGDGTYESTLATTDYELLPYNTTPKTRLELSANSDYGSFAGGVRKGIEITGTWGYSVVPDAISQACLIQVCRWYKRRDTGYAVVIGGADVGEVAIYHGLDPDIKALLAPMIRRTKGGI